MNRAAMFAAADAAYGLGIAEWRASPIGTRESRRALDDLETARLLVLRLLQGRFPEHSVPL